MIALGTATVATYTPPLLWEGQAAPTAAEARPLILPQPSIVISFQFPSASRQPATVVGFANRTTRMRSIAIINQKGGVGKTTSAVNLSAALAAAGQRVGLIDIDPQAHASLHLGLDPKRSRSNVYDLLTRDVELDDVWQQAGEKVSVASAHIDLAAAEVELAGVVGRELILRDKLSTAKEQGEYDFVIVDCPPSLGILTLNALAAVDDVFLPLQPHFLALHGLSKLLQTIELVSERLNNRLRLAGVVLCLYESGTRLAVEVSGDVEQFFQAARDGSRAWSQVRLFDTRIRRNIRLAEAPSFGQSILKYAPDSHGAKDYRELAGEVLAYYAGRDLLDQERSSRAA